MNIFFADHRHKKYKLKSQCSPGHPFERILGEGKVSFTDPEKLIAYLKNSCEAAYMWSDSEDLAIIADMYQLKIKVITTKGSDDENPTVNWIHPDDTLKEFAELRDFKMDDMVLLHENDSHFNLVISEDSDLAKLGSLSHRENAKSTKDDLSGTNLKKELKQCKDSKKMIETEYLKCEQELRLKTEEVERLKIEIKDLKKIKELEDMIKDNLNDSSTSDEVLGSEDDLKDLWKMKKSGHRRRNPQYEAFPTTMDKDNFTKKAEEISCDECEFKGRTKSDIMTHIISKHSGNNSFDCKECNYKTFNKFELESHSEVKHTRFESTNNRKPTWGSSFENMTENEYNCHECDFQGTSKPQLEKHISLKHTNHETIRCRNCDEGFLEMKSLMNHRKNKHPSSVAPCRNFPTGNCIFTNEMCWWKHCESEQSENNDRNVCYICNERCESMEDMMKHRKNQHPEVVKECFKFSNNMCSFRSETCWFNHERYKTNTAQQESAGINAEPSVFREDQRRMKPPIGKTQKKQQKPTLEEM